MFAPNLHGEREGMTMPKKTAWLNRALLESPYCYRLCVTEKDFHAELKRLGLPKNGYPEFLKTTHANATTNFFQSKDGQLCAIVNMRKEDGLKHKKCEVYGLLVHEAVHIWREVRENIGESYPSHEIEAYAVQRIAQNLIWSWEKQVKK
jgi:hypothetical protein